MTVMWSSETMLEGAGGLVPPPPDRPLTLPETLELIAPVAGPRDPLPDCTDVVIVGAGPVGLTVANLLGSYGINCILLEKNPETSDLPKAIAVDDDYMRVLDGVGLSEVLKPHLSAPFGVHFLSRFGFALVKVPGFITPNGFGNRNATLQPVFEKIILEGCRRFSPVRICFDASLSTISQNRDEVTMVVKTSSGTSELRARYVLACDGARSFVRSAIGVAFPGNRIDEPHLVLDLANFPDQVPYSRFFCHPARPVNSVPAPYGGRRIEFMLHPADDRGRILSDAGIRELVDRHTPYRGVPLHIIRRAIYGFSERIADRLQVGRVFLLGDAAHVMPPFGGQGMNTGARDAANLCWKIVAVFRDQASPAALQSYDQERRDHIRAIVDYSVRVGRLANIRSPVTGLARDIAFALANVFPGVRRYFREMRHLPRPFLKQGLLVRGPGEDDGVTGRIFPRLYLLAANAEPTSIDGVAGTWFALVGVDVPLGELERFGLLRPWRDLQPRLIALVDEQADRRSTGTYSVKDERGREFLGRHRGKIMIVRPDRYVAGCAAAGQFESIGNDFATRLGLAGSRGVAAPSMQEEAIV